MRFSQQKYIFHLSALRFKIIFQKIILLCLPLLSTPSRVSPSSVSSEHHVQVLGDEDQSSIKFNLAFLSSHHERAYSNSFCNATFSIDTVKLFDGFLFSFCSTCRVIRKMALRLERRKLFRLALFVEAPKVKTRYVN